MYDGSADKNRRILIVDDNAAIHEDFRKILGGNRNSENLDSVATALFGSAQSAETEERYEIDSALQGEEGAAKVVQALKANQPYALAFVDMRMPPGWDGVETIRRLWNEDPAVQVVIHTAYSDYSWSDIVKQLGRRSDQLLILNRKYSVLW